MTMLTISIEALRRRLQSLALVDAIRHVDWDDRVFTFNARWGHGVMQGSYKNGFGDSWHVLFLPEGALLVGTDTESPLHRTKHKWSGLPPAFAAALEEPIFEAHHATFCLYRLTDDEGWHALDPHPKDGSEELLAPMLAPPDPLPAIASILRHEPLTEAMVREINPEQSLSGLADEVHDCGYGRAE